MTTFDCKVKKKPVENSTHGFFLRLMYKLTGRNSGIDASNHHAAGVATVSTIK